MHINIQLVINGKGNIFGRGSSKSTLIISLESPETNYHYALKLLASNKKKKMQTKNLMNNC